MSLTGIAIAIGVLVDAAIVVTENVIRHCETGEKEKGRALTASERWQTTLVACKQVGRPIFFAMAIIMLAFVPVFALTGQEGKLFHPLAFTKTFAMIGATLLAMTLVPVLCSLLVRGPYHEEDRNIVMKFLMRIYDPALSWALRHRKTVIAAAVLLLTFCLLLAFGLPRAIAEANPRRRLRPHRRSLHGIRPRVHAAAQRGQPAAHARDDAENRPQGNPARHVMAGQDHRRHSRGGNRGRQTRPLRNRHRSRPDRNAGNHHHAQAGIHPGRKIPA